VGDSQLHMHPDDARELGLDDGDYVWVDANEADRPYVGWTPDDPYYEVARLMTRFTFNPGYPRGVTMLKHAFYMATAGTVRAQKQRPDGRALAESGYQSSFRHGSQQSITRGWAPPMHQTDSLFHKRAGAMGFVFGFDIDNHAINTVPKETLIRITKAEPGGTDGRSAWRAGTTGMAPGGEDKNMQRYLAGGLVAVKGRS
jgi:nitrate reductase alpha subunit